MKVTYVGDDNLPPQKTKFLGYEFTLGESIEVTDEKHLTTFRKHRCFKVSRAKTDDSLKKAKSLSDDDLKQTIIENGLEIKDRKKSSAVAAVAEFFKSQEG